MLRSTSTLGIDLASQPSTTALCSIEWTEGIGRVLPPSRKRLTDETLLDEIRAPAVSKVGIDAPFGWPGGFVEAIRAYRDELVWPVSDPKELEFRATEFRIKKETGDEPLSAVTDWLVWPTMRCARLLSRLTETDPAPRSGEGRLFEVYPAAALFRWGLSPAAWIEDPGSYKGDKPGRIDRRRRLVEMLQDATQGYLDLADPERFIDSDHELDSLVCALVARAAERDLVDEVSDDARDVVDAEGWIRLPFGASTLSSLA